MPAGQLPGEGGHDDTAPSAQRWIFVVAEQNFHGGISCSADPIAPTGQLHYTVSEPVGVCAMSKSLPSSVTALRDGASVRTAAALPGAASPKLAARLEPFDSYWQAPADVDSGYKSFS